jgi:Mg2+-importing ATPase
MDRHFWRGCNHSLTGRQASEGHSFKRLLDCARLDIQAVLEQLDTTAEGLSELQAKLRRSKVGYNEIARKGAPPWYVQLGRAFQNPLVMLLLCLATIALCTGDGKSAVIILSMIVVGVALRFSQEFQSNRAAERLRAMVHTTATVSRRDPRKDISPSLARDLGLVIESKGEDKQEVPIALLVPGDVISLAAGDMIPADVRILTSRDLFVSQGTLTGESIPVEKQALLSESEISNDNALELHNLCFLGTNVVTGSATAVVVETGANTYLGSLAKQVTSTKPITNFDRGINDVSRLLLRFMVCMVPVVFLANGVFKGNWTEAFFFALSVAVGLTPEMLPMIVTATLARGANAMSKKRVIVKNIDAIQSFGAMDILCTDKTGTLTQDKIVLERHLDVFGVENDEVLEFAYLNSFYQSGLKNLLDVAVLTHGEVHESLNVEQSYKKIDEIPFDFTRRRMSVIVEEQNHHHELICKGAVEEILQICTHAKVGDQALSIDANLQGKIAALHQGLNEEGLRVIAVAYKELAVEPRRYTVSDEQGLLLLGFIAFLDPPKDSAARALSALSKGGIEVKVLTGDNDRVARKTCKDVGLSVTGTLLGSDIEKLSDSELGAAVKSMTIFAKVTPLQKARIVKLLRNQGHVVGFMGDGINDTAALREADVGISVDSAVDIAKESADIILLEKSLLVLHEGVLEGRRTFGNIIKYIKMGTSSNFGNMFSVLGASALLPFLPMLPVQVLLNNLLYDFSQMGIPFDHVDPEYLERPQQWQVSEIRRFMFMIGPISSLFDFVTFGVLWWIFRANSIETQGLFHTGWFIESLITQTLIVHIIRTNKIPWLESSAAMPMLLNTLVIIMIGIYLPYSPIGGGLGFVPLPGIYFVWLLGIIIGYCSLTQLVKVWILRRYQHS